MSNKKPRANRRENAGFRYLHQRERSVNLVMSTHSQYFTFLIFCVSRTFQGWLNTPPGVKQDSGGAQVKVLEPKNPGYKSGTAQTTALQGDGSEFCFLSFVGQGQTRLKIQALGLSIKPI